MNDVKKGQEQKIEFECRKITTPSCAAIVRKPGERAPTSRSCETMDRASQ
jgi:hypothetical protein